MPSTWCPLKGLSWQSIFSKVISDVHTTVTFYVTPPAQSAENEQCDWRKSEQAVSAHIAFAFHNNHTRKREFR